MGVSPPCASSVTLVSSASPPGARWLPNWSKVVMVRLLMWVACVVSVQLLELFTRSGPTMLVRLGSRAPAEGGAQVSNGQIEIANQNSKT